MALLLCLGGCASPGSTSGPAEGGSPTAVEIEDGPGDALDTAPSTAGGPDDTESPDADTGDTAGGTADDSTTQATEATFVPERVVIESIGLDEDLIDLGIAADGAMEVPEDAAEAGWFTPGGRPGGHGPTVIAGHVDSPTGGGVFALLTELAEGDRIEVHGPDGEQVEYVVTEVGDHPKDTFPTERVFGATGRDTLRLITCTGLWDSGALSYVDNRVVYAEPVDAGA